MTPVKRPQLAHFGLYVHDLERMVEFYTSLFGLQVTDQGERPARNDKLVFLSSDPGAHHQLVLASGRPAEATFTTVMQLAFKVQDIQELRTVRDDALRLGCPNLRCLDHGASLSIYFADPEGNTLECYVDTAYYIEQPHGDPLNLDLTDSEIESENERRCRADSTFMLMKDWQSRFVAGSANA